MPACCLFRQSRFLQNVGLSFEGISEYISEFPYDCLGLEPGVMVTWWFPHSLLKMAPAQICLVMIELSWTPIWKAVIGIPLVLMARSYNTEVWFPLGSLDDDDIGYWSCTNWWSYEVYVSFFFFSWFEAVCLMCFLCCFYRVQPQHQVRYLETFLQMMECQGDPFLQVSFR